MKQAQRAIILMATAQTLMELSQGLEVETSEQEIIGALNMCGLDGTGILANNSLIRAIQIVCKEFGSIELTDTDITEMIGDFTDEQVDDYAQAGFATE